MTGLGAGHSPRDGESSGSAADPRRRNPVVMPTGRPADRAAPLPGAAPGLAACRRSRRAALGPAPDPAAAWRSALLLALNPDTLTIEHAVALTDQPAPGSDDIAFAGGLIWVAGTRSLTAVNPAAATITATVPLPAPASTAGFTPAPTSPPSAAALRSHPRS